MTKFWAFVRTFHSDNLEHRIQREKKVEMRVGQRVRYMSDTEGIAQYDKGGDELVIKGSLLKRFKVKK